MGLWPVVGVAVLGVLAALWGPWRDGGDGGSFGTMSVADRVKTADEFAVAGEHVNAVQEYVSILRSGPVPHPEIIIFNLALSFSALGLHEKALTSFTQASDLIPLNVLDEKLERKIEAESLAGQSGARLGWYERAASHFQNAVNLQPSSAVNWFNLGISLLSLYQIQTDSALSPTTILRASEALRTCSKLQPNNWIYKAHLGAALVLTESCEECVLEGEKILEEFLSADHGLGDVSEGKMNMFIGFILGDSNPKAAAPHLDRAAYLFLTDKSKSVGNQVSSIYYRLGRAYRAQNLLQKEQETYVQAVRNGIWTSTMQRPGYVFPGRSLPSGPFPKEEQGLLTDPKFGQLWDAIREIEASASKISNEYKAFVNYHQNSGLMEDTEQIADQGKWHQLTFARNGKKIPDMWANDTKQAFSETLRILTKLRESGLSMDLPKGSMEFSILSPHSHLRPHCGPSNHRVRLHLGIFLPKPSAKIRVGDKERTWEEGKVLVLDDSYDHEVWNDSDDKRVVLLIDVWHPHLTDQDRIQVRDHFRFSQNSWKSLHRPLS
ncbi:hypothetical protein AAMO2058_000331300 [Amorphochlora amoebiformis]